jgi:hypothetical protein
VLRLALLAPPAAAKDVVVYVCGKDLCRVAPDGRQKHRLTHGGAYSRPSLSRTFNGGRDCCDGLFGDAFVAELSRDGRLLLDVPRRHGRRPRQRGRARARWQHHDHGFHRLV